MNQTEDFRTISGFDLMLMEFPQHQFCIQDVLPKGLNILFAENMDNARYLAMDLSLHVAAGQDLWDMEVKQGAVLHMIHQDTLAVTRNRIIAMTKRVPDDLYIGVMTEDSLALPLSAIPAFVKSHPGVSLVVVELETPVACVSQKLYAPGELLLQYTCLKELAEKNDIAILIVQRRVNSSFSLSDYTTDGPVCISDTVECHYELDMAGYPGNKGLLKRISRSYGNARWEIEYSPKTHRWEEQRRK